MAQQSATPVAAISGGVEELSREKAALLGRVASLVRTLPEEHALLLAGVVEEFARDGYLERVRSHEPPIVKIFAEVANGWDEDGAYEFARAWASTLVARDDGFQWDGADEVQKRQHRSRVARELARRGVLPPRG